MATLQLQTRADASSAGTRRLLKSGVLPMALIAKGGVTQKVQADRVAARALFHDISGVAIFDVDVEGKSSKVIMKDVQRDPVSRQVTHLTVMEITDEDVVKVNIPVVVEGTPVAVTKRAATLMVPMNQLTIKAKVKDLPDQIIVDASKLRQNDKLVVGDLKYGDKIEFLHSDQTVLASTKQLRGMTTLDAEAAMGDAAEDAETTEEATSESTSAEEATEETAAE
ncbi:50S ribosomal protein L25 [bacterium]|jgi:large subunit ribosomal protein L25|nr:50S ribosomal protein L25 [bacterium]